VSYVLGLVQRAAGLAAQPLVVPARPALWGSHPSIAAEAAAEAPVDADAGETSDDPAPRSSAIAPVPSRPQDGPVMHAIPERSKQRVPLATIAHVVADQTPAPAVAAELDGAWSPSTEDAGTDTLAAPPAQRLHGEQPRERSAVLPVVFEPQSSPPPRLLHAPAASVPRFQREADRAPQVHVRIGRVEVRNVTPPPAATPPLPAAPRGFDQYAALRTYRSRAW
jgi:hypothetical protein